MVIGKRQARERADYYVGMDLAESATLTSRLSRQLTITLNAGETASGIS